MKHQVAAVPLDVAGEVEEERRGLAVAFNMTDDARDCPCEFRVDVRMIIRRE